MAANPKGGKLAGTIKGGETAFAAVRSYGAAALNFRNVYKGSLADAERCRRMVSRPAKSQFWRRTFTRTLFAHIEGTIHGLKKLILSQYECKRISLSFAERALLREEKYELDGNGKPITHPTNYPKFLANFRFVFYCAAKCCKTTYALDEQAIPDLKKFEQIRNKLTHPKNGEDLIVLDGNLEICLRAQAWFALEMNTLASKLNIERPTARQLLPSRKQKIKITQPYVVMLPNGNLYEFKKRGDAKLFAQKSWNGNALTKPGFWHCKGTEKITVKF